MGLSCGRWNLTWFIEKTLGGYMRIILSGGGTGGHIMPALAIADELKKTEGVEIFYVGKEGSLEEELVQREGIKFYPIPVEGLPRKKISAKTIHSMWSLSQGMRACGKILKEIKPDVVIGTGGYVCAPVVLKAQQYRIPTVLQEQNAFPGKANRFLAKKASFVALNFKEAKVYFKRKDNLIYTGNPVRQAFLDKISQDKKDNREEKIVLSFGGSGGQESTNDAIKEIIKSHDKLPFHLIHITGRDYYEEFMEDVEEREDLEILSFSLEIPNLMDKADVVIASSSAMTLAEISALSKASILIPKAYTAGNHQVFNGKSYESQGASVLIYEEDLTGEKLYAAIEDLLKDDKKRQSMGQCAHRMCNEEAVKEIAKRILELGSHGKEKEKTNS